MTSDGTRRILEIAFSNSAVARMHELARKNQEGTITTKELAELDHFVTTGDLIAILQSKARKALKSAD